MAPHHSDVISLDDPHFVARYHQAVQDYRDQLARERRKKLRVA
ncbi:hypothetical protein J2Z21_009811 [Streptomyces griseochromogenes]|uniref:Uncharacterized protein n=1 Tax=Streptomyces griseochromogenes TaxID=68214 RepID=A0ABS4MBI9_9ACTN|nr:hypothetical protein [Streptomyces griseochromogenes]MBP2056792.1 hypothetical protein [Streptomyces griseochromogenes]